MIQLIQASSYFQVVSLAGMVDAGLLPPAERRILVLANGSQMPEITTELRDYPGFSSLATRFDDVVDLAELLWPRRCAQFNPRNEELTLFETLLRHRWALGASPVSLVLESVQVNPAQALARIFFDAPIFVHSDGLMSYGPTRSPLPHHMVQRLKGTIHIDLVPGLEPILLHGTGVTRTVLSLEALGTVFAEVTRESTSMVPDLPVNAALLLGQYLGSLGILDSDAEFELHQQMLLEAQSAGATEVVFKPHPSAGPTAALQLRSRAESLGLKFQILNTDLLAETVIALMDPLVVISCFSTALTTARYLLKVPTLAVGTTDLLQHLAPYQNSNRVPLTLIEALFVTGVPTPAAARDSDRDDLSHLVRSVAYCMQAEQLPELRTEVAGFLAAHYSEYANHFKRRRLAALGLPPRWAHPHPGHTTTTVIRRIAGRSVRGARRRGARMFTVVAQKLEVGAGR